MLKLTDAFSSSSVFIRASDVIAVRQTDDCTLVFMQGDHMLEVKEDAEKIVRYICEKNNYSGNDQYDTLETKVIEKDWEAFDVMDSALSYAAKYLEKKLEEEKEEGKYVMTYHQTLLDQIKDVQRRIASVTLREVE